MARHTNVHIAVPSRREQRERIKEGYFIDFFWGVPLRLSFALSSTFFYFKRKFLQSLFIYTEASQCSREGLRAIVRFVTDK